MPSGALQVNDDGTLLLEPQRAQNPQGLEDALSLFADRTNPSETPPRYRLSAASVWRARRMGLSLERIIQPLETHSGQELPDKLRADLTLWSQQIDRLWLEVDRGRLVLRSANPLVITAVVRHRTLRDLVIEQLDATTAELRADLYPALMATFDACRYPVMDRVPPEWKPGAVPTASVDSPEPVLPPRAAPRTKSRARRSSRPRPRKPASARCQAITKAGRLCKNRVRSGASYCRVHASHDPMTMPFDPTALEILYRIAYQAAFDEEEVLSLAELSRGRVSVLMWIGLSAWLLYHLVMIALGWGMGWSFPSWLVAGVAMILSCVGLGRLVAGLSGLKSLEFVGFNLLSLGMDCLHKEGLIANFCYVVIPVVIPIWLLSQLGLSWAWVFLCFPVGLYLGELVYTFLDATSV